MKKRILYCLIFILLVFSVNVAAFTDVLYNDENYSAITYLSEKGIFTGYTDGTFRPGNNITRAEVSAVICRSSGLAPEGSKSIYLDIDDSHWAKGYIMSATNAGIINGNGDGRFNPDDNVTYNEIIKMLVCMIAPGEDFSSSGHWARGYVEYAYESDIIDYNAKQSILSYQGDYAADRQNVAKLVYKAVTLESRNSVDIGNIHLVCGMSAEGLSYPDEILESPLGFDWYVYGTATYMDFYAVGVKENKVVSIASSGLGFKSAGVSYGSAYDANLPSSIYFDSNDNNIVHSVLILSEDDINTSSVPTQKQFENESKMNFHFTNAFRVAHGLVPYKWNEIAALTARLHSEDMANQDYFEHTSLDGLSPGGRLTRQGLSWRECGENIAAGSWYNLGFYPYNAWVNSNAHRTNMLGNCKEMGVGAAYNEASVYEFYYTQNMVTVR